MSENVSQALAGRSTTLFEKLASNEALSNLIMGFLGYIIISCAKQGKAVASVRCTPITESLGDFRFRIEYMNLLVPTPVMWSAHNDMERYVGGKSASMAKAFEVNPTLVKTFTDLVGKIDQYCKHKGIAFKNFKIKKSFVTPNHMVVIRSGEASMDTWKGAGRY